MMKLSKKVVVGLLIGLVSFAGLFAQSENVDSKSKKNPDIVEGSLIVDGRNGLSNKNAIGIYFTGSEKPIGGIQYERRYNKLISQKINGFIFATENSMYENCLNYNVNTEIQFRLFEFAYKDNFASRLYAYLMVGYKGYKSNPNYYTYNSYDSYDSTPAYDGTLYHTALGGIGFGFDMIVVNHISIPIQFGFTCAYPNDFFAGFCAGTAIRFSY